MRLFLLGAGGHAIVAASVARELGYSEVVILTDDATAHGSRLLQWVVQGPIDAYDGHSPALTAIGSNQARKKIAARFPSAEWVTLVHPRAWVDLTAQVGVGSVVYAGAIVQPLVQIGVHSIVNTGATIDHECVLGDYAQVSPGANLAGDVHLGEGAFVGIGAAIHQGARLGAWSVVGGGAFVKGTVLEGTTVVGVPARPRGT